MTTELKSKKASSKSDDADLRRQFAELETRIRRADVTACLLMLSLAIVTYALLMGLFGWLTYSSQASWIAGFRWSSYVVFAVLMGFLAVRTIRCGLRRINPYYLAHQLEQTLPNAKNSLINWVDLRDEDLPTAFRRNLTARAAEQLDECDPDPIVRQRKNRILLLVLPVPVVGLLILLIFGPWAFFSSMLQAFAPFVEADSGPRTQITLLQPTSEDAEVGPNQSLTVTVKIEGRVPAIGASDAPKLLYHYQANEKYLVQPLEQDEGGNWSVQLLSPQLSTGIFYRVAAGDATTPEYRVRRGTGVRVTSISITYHYPAYHKFAPRTDTFPNKEGTQPFVVGPAGTEIELVAHTNRPVQKAAVEFSANKAKTSLATQIVARDPQGFVCRWKLERSGVFRLGFTSTEGDEYIDRNDYKILVTSESAPKVILMTPAEQVDWPENGTLIVTGKAQSSLGLKNMTLRLRVAKGIPNPPKLRAMPYRADTAFYKLADGTYRPALDYQDVLMLNQLRDEKGGIQLFPPGTVLEYWLEATDAADNIGKSQPPQTITLIPAIDPEKFEAQRQQAMQQQKQHEKQQQERLAKENSEPTQGRGPGEQKSQGQSEKDTKSAEDAKNKIQQALQQPGNKSPEDPGKSKDEGDKTNSSGESRDNGDKKDGDKKEPASKGESKDAPKESSSPAKDQGGMEKPEPAGGAKEDGPKGKDSSEASTAKENSSENGAPMPQSKQGGKEESAKDTPPDQGDEKTSPDPTMGPTAQNKAGAKKPPSSEQAKQKEPSWDEMAKMVEKLPQRDAEGNAAAKELAEIGKMAADERKRDIAKEALDKNQRDPSTGQPLDTKPKQPDNTKPFDPKLKIDGPKSKPGSDDIKGPNPNGTLGSSKGRNDDLKTMAANREFLRRIGQMQLDDWKKRVTPDLLKRAGVTETEANQAYDAMVRKLNAKLRGKTDLRDGPPPSSNGPSVIDGGKTGTDSLDAARAEPPPELRDPQFRFSTKKTGP